MYIAICDDDPKIASRLEHNINMIYKRLKVDFSISIFENGTDLIDMIKKDEIRYDILLLDVDMPGISGLEVARILREINEDIIIMFISSYEKYVFDTFEYNPFRYIRKSRIKEELNLALRSAYTLYQKRKRRHITIKSEQGEYRVEISEIFYFEIENRKLYVYLTDNRVFSMWKTIKEFINEIGGDDFVKIHSGCAVNMKYIKEYTNYDVILDDGKVLPVSRTGIKILKDELTRYWGENI